LKGIEEVQAARLIKSRMASGHVQFFGAGGKFYANFKRAKLGETMKILMERWMGLNVCGRKGWMLLSRRVCEL
jgi:hypothetical protein